MTIPARTRYRSWYLPVWEDNAFAFVHVAWQCSHVLERNCQKGGHTHQGKKRLTVWGSCFSELEGRMAIVDTEPLSFYVELVSRAEGDLR